MKSQTGYQVITIHIVPDISRSKSNQTKKLGQLIGCDMQNIFLGKSCTKNGGETSLRYFFKKSKLCISIYQQTV